MIHCVFQWNEGGSEVLICGSFNQWEVRIPMQKTDGGMFQLFKELTPGLYQYKFIVDGQWKCAYDQERTFDDQGNENN